jgi:type I restriction enzyme S subunit
MVAGTAACPYGDNGGEEGVRVVNEEAQNGLPPGWVRTSVDELFKVLGGGTPSTGRPEFWDGTIPWITSADIDEQHHVTPRRAITEAAIADSVTNLVPPSSVIVVTRVGLGKVGLATEALCFS